MERVKTKELADALAHVMDAIEAKGVDKCSQETQDAYYVMRRFVDDATGGGDVFAVVYYP
jgi:hypothetical protein